jgi:DNA-binding transcriptional ArsR family regulator
MRRGLDIVTPEQAPKGYDARMAKALAHPLRAEILTLLEQRTASPNELANELAAPLVNVSYHVKILAKSGLIELVRTSRRRGATAHHYRAVPGAVAHLSVGAPAAGQTSTLPALIGQIVKQVRSELRGAAKGGASADVGHASGTSLLLDEHAWQELLAAVEELHDLALRLQLQSARRLRRAHGDREREASLVLMLLEARDSSAPAASEPEPRPNGD